MNKIIKGAVLAAMVVSMSACGIFKTYGSAFKYMATGEMAAPPARTIDAAKAQFNDTNLQIGKATAGDIESSLGSPSEINKVGASRVYVYLKSVATSGVSTDTGTMYVASYTVGSNGKLAEKEYAAKPMGNPLTGQ